MEGWTDRQARPAPAPGQRMTPQCHRLRAEENVYDIDSLY